MLNPLPGCLPSLRAVFSLLFTGSPYPPPSRSEPSNGAPNGKSYHRRTASKPKAIPIHGYKVRDNFSSPVKQSNHPFAAFPESTDNINHHDGAVELTKVV